MRLNQSVTIQIDKNKAMTFLNAEFGIAEENHVSYAYVYQTIDGDKKVCAVFRVVDIRAIYNEYQYIAE